MARMARWEELEESALSGDEIAAFELAMCHASGSSGLGMDLVQAHRWFNVASARGYAPAGTWRTEIAAEMSAVEIVAAQKLARSTLAVPTRRMA